MITSSVEKKKKRATPGEARAAADARSVGKRLIVLSDGTGNSSGKLFKTNVWRLYEAIELGPAPDDDVTQIAFYDDGVGSSSFKPLAVLGGALGLGLSRNVQDIYAFLCRHWAENDEIYCFGFSRGAFTIRVLTGVINSQGIITNFDDESDLRRKVATAYRKFRRDFEPDPPARWIVTIIRNLRDKTIAARDRLFSYPPYPGAPETDKVTSAADGIRRNQPANITFVGLWDTVDAYGLPIDEMTRAWDKYIWPLSMRDRQPADCVERAVHMLSLDDERNTFHPVLWDERNITSRASEVAHVDQASMAQIWFSGVHSDVGGGYPNDRLSYIPLMFVIDRIDRNRLQNFGLRLNAAKLEQYAAAADLDGLHHDSRKGLGGYYRYLPRRFDLLNLLRRQPHEEKADPTPPLRTTDGSNPDIPTPLIHETALQRIEHGSQGYAPVILPKDYKVVTRRAGTFPEGEVRPQSDFSAIDPNPAQRAVLQEQVWNWVWLRRIVYFATVFVTSWFLFMPFLERIEATDGNDPSYDSALSALPEQLGGFLPSLAKPWIDVYRAHPSKSVALTAAIVLGLLFGSILASTIRDAMQHVWRGQTGYEGIGWRAANSFVFRLRTSNWYLKFFFGLKTKYLPALFAVLFAYVGIALLSHGLFAVRETWSPTCVETKEAEKVLFKDGKAVSSTQFDPRQLCWASGIPLQGGRRYRLTIVANDAWADDGIPADLYGLDFDELSVPMRIYAETVMFLGLPLRRYIGGRWFALYHKVGSTGRDVQLHVNSVRPPPRNLQDRRQAQFEFQAHRNGELFLFLNDAVPIGLVLDFYRNNKGLATVAVERLPWRQGPADPEE